MACEALEEKKRARHSETKRRVSNRESVAGGVSAQRGRRARSSISALAPPEADQPPAIRTSSAASPRRCARAELAGGRGGSAAPCQRQGAPPPLATAPR